MTPDSELLASFARTNSEAAFAELVRRHIDLVHSTALRQVAGDVHLAQDVAQSVFADLARKAASLARRESLTGWLYTSAHFAAAKAIRTESRRRDREEKFMRDPTHESAPAAEWENLQPLIDATMHELKEPDREAILLRYFENRPYAEVGARLGLNENAARMRVDRALEKLRAAFAKRGVTTTSVMAAALSAHAVQAAPIGLAATLSTTILTTSTATTFTLFKFMTATQVKLAAATLIVAGGATAFVVQQQATNTLRADNAALTQQLTQAQADNQTLSNRLASSGDPQAKLPDDQMKELLRLRGEVTTLRQQVGQIAQLQAENQRLRSRPAPTTSASQAPDLSTPEGQFQEQKVNTVNALKQIGLAMRIFAGDNNDRYATNFDQLTNELSSTNFAGGITVGNFEFTYPGIVSETMPDVIMFREITPRVSPSGVLERAYGMADGSVQEISGGGPGETAQFTQYEAAHSPQAALSPPPQNR